jgi:glycosyltransferase involved in cell wall biosynthesis
MPSYNSGSFLREAIDSALVDTRVELIIQDSLSKDGTCELLREYAGDPRVLVIREEDSGQADALNRALSRASGDWIGWLNADDFYAERSILTVLDTIAAGAAGGYSIVYGDYQLVDRTGRTLRTYRVGPWSWQRIFRRGCYMFSGATFIKREELERVSGLDGTLHFCMDFDLFLRLGTSVRALKLEESLGALRIHDGSKTFTKGQKFAGEALRVRRKYSQTRIAAAIGVLAYMRTIIYVTFGPIRFSKPYSFLRRRKNL